MVGFRAATGSPGSLHALSRPEYHGRLPMTLFRPGTESVLCARRLNKHVIVFRFARDALEPSRRHIGF